MRRLNRAALPFAAAAAVWMWAVVAADEATVAAALDRGHTTALREGLATLARGTSVDHAATVLAEALEALPRNRAFRARLEGHAEVAPAALGNASSRYLFLMVPGWRYLLNPETGADLARPRAVLERMGFEARLVPLDQNGTVEDNATALAAELGRLETEGRALVLVSTSKGGPETHLALDLLRREDRARHVAAWVNIGGLLNGSGVADFWETWPQSVLAMIGFALQGLSTRSIASMTTETSRARFAAATLPEHVLVVNYLAVPMAAEVTPPAQSNYTRLAPQGPNDGLTLLADAIVPQGITVVARGLDHFYAAPDLDQRIAATALAIVGELEARPGR